MVSNFTPHLGAAVGYHKSGFGWTWDETWAGSPKAWCFGAQYFCIWVPAKLISNLVQMPIKNQSGSSWANVHLRELELCQKLEDVDTENLTFGY